MEKEIGFASVLVGDVVRAETGHEDTVFARQGKVATIANGGLYSEKGVLIANDKPDTHIVLLDRPKEPLPVPNGAIVSFREKGEMFLCTRISPSTWLVVITDDSTGDTRQTAYSDNIVGRHHWETIYVPAKKEVKDASDHEALAVVG